MNQALILSGPDIPKYGGGLLQKANSLGSATYGDHIADVSPVFELFVQQNSELSYPDWVDFYQETRDAEKELTGATNLLRKYMTRLRDTADGILEDELCREWAEDMVYRRPFQGFTREPGFINQMFFKNVSFEGGPAPVRNYLEELMEDVLQGTLDPSPVLDKTVGLEEVPEGYEAMDNREAIKVMVRLED